jgi:SAM-dependent methyltransferase
LCPSTPGRYLLELDLVQETVAWFEELTVQLPCRIVRGIVPDYDFHTAWAQADLEKDFWSISGPGSFEEFRAIAEHKMQILLARGLSPTSRILDVGCATGSLPTVLVDYLEPEGRYFGTDIVQKAIDFCRERYPQPNFEFAVNEPTGIPIRDETFDFITLFSVFTHMLPEDIEKLTASLAQFLAPGGQLVADAFVSDQIRGYRGSHTKADIEEAVLVRAFNRSGFEIASREHLNTEGDVRRVLFTLTRAG